MPSNKKKKQSNVDHVDNNANVPADNREKKNGETKNGETVLDKKNELVTNTFDGSSNTDKVSLPSNETTTPTVKGLLIKQLNDPRWLERVKVLDRYVFPVKYTDAHYERVKKIGWHPFSLVAFYNDFLVGVCTCRMEKIEEEKEELRLYCMTLGVLEAYRRMGIASQLMKTLIENVAKDKNYHISHLALHVHVKMTPAIEFYKKFGFEEKEIVKDYYTDLEDKNAILMTKVIPQPHFAMKKSKSQGKKSN